MDFLIPIVFICAGLYGAYLLLTVWLAGVTGNREFAVAAAFAIAAVVLFVFVFVTLASEA